MKKPEVALRTLVDQSIAVIMSLSLVQAPVGGRFAGHGHLLETLKIFRNHDLFEPQCDASADRLDEGFLRIPVVDQ